MTATTITLGVEWLNVPSAASQAFFGHAISTGDGEKQARATIDFLNSHGGIAGRHVQAVYHKTEFSDRTANPGPVAQAGCADFTQDHQIFAALVYDAFAQLDTCLAKHNVPVFALPYYPIDQTLQDQLRGYYYMPDGANITRTSDIRVPRLVKTNWLKKTAKVGVVYSTIDASTMRAGKHLIDVLTQAGFAPAATYAWDGSSSSDMANAVLKFRSAGIDHVMFGDVGGGACLFFTNAAESQQYRPLYSLTTNDLPQSMALLTPSAQMQNATGVSWNNYDVGAANDAPANATRTRCLQIMRKGGVDVSDRTSEYGAVALCDVLLFMGQVMSRAPALTVQGILASVQGIGNRFTGGLSFRNTFGPHRFDGAGATRLISFDKPCTCFTFTPDGPVATP